MIVVLFFPGHNKSYGKSGWCSVQEGSKTLITCHMQNNDIRETCAGSLYYSFRLTVYTGYKHHHNLYLLYIAFCKIWWWQINEPS